MNRKSLLFLSALTVALLSLGAVLHAGTAVEPAVEAEVLPEVPTEPAEEATPESGLTLEPEVALSSTVFCEGQCQGGTSEVFFPCSSNLNAAECCNKAQESACLTVDAFVGFCDDSAVEIDCP